MSDSFQCSSCLARLNMADSFREDIFREEFAQIPGEERGGRLTQHHRESHGGRSSGGCSLSRPLSLSRTAAAASFRHSLAHCLLQLQDLFALQQSECRLQTQSPSPSSLPPPAARQSVVHRRRHTRVDRARALPGQGAGGFAELKKIRSSSPGFSIKWYNVLKNSDRVYASDCILRLFISTLETHPKYI